MLKTVDNFQGNLDVTKTKPGLKKVSKPIGYKGYLSKAKRKIKPLNITLADYIGSDSTNSVFNILGQFDDSCANDLICSIAQKQSQNDNECLFAQTGNYIGKFKWQGLDIDIQSRFSNLFLQRMLNFANDVYLDDVAVFDAKDSSDLDFSKFIIYYMFVQKLEKAFLLGLPKSYRTVRHHEMQLKGQIDFNRFIKHDIPFQGKISSIARERQETQELIDVLHKAVSIVDRESQCGSSPISTKNIRHIKLHLKQQRSHQCVSQLVIQKAMASKVLQNSIYAPYKQVLEYAKLIINHAQLEEDNKRSEKKSFGFLVNVAELFEIYVRKLLQKAFPDWRIYSPEIEVYKDQFYARKIIPDIIMQQEKQVFVFDTKYKRMTMRGRGPYGAGDLDRNDFFQINTYMTYYSQQGFDVLAGGLLYPMECEFDQDKCYGNQWFGDTNSKFVVDGIGLFDLPELEEGEPMFQHIKERERAFINRIHEMIGGAYG